MEIVDLDLLLADAEARGALLESASLVLCTCARSASVVGAGPAEHERHARLQIVAAGARRDHGPTAERRPPRAQLVENDADGVHVGGCVGGAPGALLGRHVRRRLQHLAGAGQRAVALRRPGPRDPEVDEPHPCPVPEEERIRHIVADLRTFAHGIDGEAAPAATDVRKVLDFATTITANEVRHRGRVTTRYEAVPAVIGDERVSGRSS